MRGSYRIVGYKDILGSCGEHDTRNDRFIGSYHDSLDDAKGQARKFLENREYFHVTIVHEVASWRLKEVEPAKTKIDSWF